MGEATPCRRAVILSIRERGGFRLTGPEVVRERGDRIELEMRLDLLQDARS